MVSRSGKRRAAHTLGRQLTNLTTAPLVERIAALSQELTKTRQAILELISQVGGLQDDLDGTRRALRQMIKNTAIDATVS